MLHVSLWINTVVYVSELLQMSGFWDTDAKALDLEFYKDF